MAEHTTGYAYGWDDEIETDGGQWALLPEGDYNFQVKSFERAHHPGSQKLPPCPKAVLSIQIDAPEGTTTIAHNLFLYSTVEWRLSEFFRSIGQKQHDQKVRMNWNAVVGATGQCRVGIRDYTKKDGSAGKANEIVKFYDPGEANASVRNPLQKQTGQSATPNAWKAGEF